jgi:hypothetical protein
VQAWAGVIIWRAIRMTQQGGASRMISQSKSIIFDRLLRLKAFRLERDFPRAVRGPVE